MHFKLPENLLLGTATAATQIEGGDTNNSWYDWALVPGHVADGTSPLRADDHYNRVDEDIALMKSLNLQIYRFGVEWSRIEPERGQFNSEAIGHYRDELKKLRDNGIQPLVTLHHFTNPRWFENMGAFENPESPELFSNFVRYTVEGLADFADEWITINEPNVYAVNGYFFGIWPPGKKNDLKALSAVYTNLAVSHIAAYRDIHRIREQKGFARNATRVGFANHLRVFTPRCKWNPVHLLSAAFMRRAFQDSLTQASMTGKASWPVKKMPASVNGTPIGCGRFYDFIGINYYSRDAVSAGKNGVFPSVPHNDLGWEIYPEGLRLLSESMYRRYKAPIYITENGTCDARDAFRSRFIYDHLKVVCESGLPIERYYHWSLMDNFEWAEGESGKFGLIAVDYETQKRTVRSSGEFYARIIQNRGVTDDMYKTFVENTRYPQ